MSSRSGLMRILFVLILIAAPASAYAVSATITVTAPPEFSVTTSIGQTDGPTTLELSDINLAVEDPSANGRIGDEECIRTGASEFGPCFVIFPGSQAVFLGAGTALGQLILHDLVVFNTGSVAATLRVDYQHSDGTINPNQPQCTGMSLDGFFLTPDFSPAVGADVQLTMDVQ